MNPLDARPPFAPPPGEIEPWWTNALGQPIPASPHAVSVALPRWDDVVGYEEKRPEVLARLRGGYPRFVIHPAVRALAEALSPGTTCLPFPSRRTAERGAAFVRATAGVEAECIVAHSRPGVRTSAAGEAALRAFWQHTGLIVSTREALTIVGGNDREAKEAEAVEVRGRLRQELAGLYDCEVEDVFLYPTGMAAQLAALDAVRDRCPGGATVQLGFPYVDTWKLQQKFGGPCQLLHDLKRVALDLADRLVRGPVAACFGEIPGNPLLGSADLRPITPLLRAQRVPLVADDVVATPYNIDLRHRADLIATSLTKFLVGTGDAMGGAVICEPRSVLHGELQSRLKARHEELLWGEDAAVLLAGVRGFRERMARHNASGLRLAERLRSHPAVERVWYPKWEFSEAYEAVRRPEGGYGALITFLPRAAAARSPQIYDRLELAKGPSLGTVFTLACPFTLLAHYTELDWAESCGVSRHLIRLSIGLEDPDELWARLDRALT